MTGYGSGWPVGRGVVRPGHSFREDRMRRTSYGMRTGPVVLAAVLAHAAPLLQAHAAECTAPRIEWINPTLPPEHLHDVWGSPAGDAWAVGAEGTILHWDGAVWSAAAVPDLRWSPEFSGVWGAGGDDVYAVGADTGAYRWDGSAWNPLDLSDVAPGSAFRDVCGTGPDDVWIVGDDGVVLHGGGASWSRVDPERTADLLAAWCPAPGRLVAAGASGTVLAYDGSTWIDRSYEHASLSPTLTGVWAPALDDVWTVGGEYFMGYLVLHFDGTAWTEIYEDYTEPWRPQAVWGTAADDVYVAGGEETAPFAPAGYGEVRHWDGSTFVSSGGAGRPLNGIWGSGPDDAWAVGDSGTIVRWDGTYWIDEGGTMVEDDLETVWGASPDDIWMASARALYHYDGEWIGEVDLPGVDFVFAEPRLAGSGPDDVFLAMGRRRGDVLHWDGSSWSMTAADGVLDLWVAGPGDVWAAAGEILHWDGSEWTVAFVSDLAGYGMKAVWGFAPDDVWAVGESDDDMIVARWNGHAWSEAPSGLGERVAASAMAGSSPSDIYVGLGQGSEFLWLHTVVHWDGTQWGPADEIWPTVRDFDVSASGRVVAVGFGETGAGGGVSIMDPGSTTNLSHVSPGDLWGVTVIDDHAWMVGETGTVVRLDLSSCPPEPPSGNDQGPADAGCGCTVPGGRTVPPGAWLLLPALAAARRRSRPA